MSNSFCKEAKISDFCVGLKILDRFGSVFGSGQTWPDHQHCFLLSKTFYKSCWPYSVYCTFFTVQLCNKKMYTRKDDILLLPRTEFRTFHRGVNKSTSFVHFLVPIGC